jgi:hypothetical protein
VARVGQWKPRVIDWCEVAAGLETEISQSLSGSIHLDGRLWALLHRVRYVGVHENPLAGIRQVHVGVGRDYTDLKYFDLPVMADDINMMWKIAKNFSGLMFFSDRLDKRFWLNDRVMRLDWKLGLGLAQEMCLQIAEGREILRYDLPPDHHVRTRKKPKEIFLETWDARIKTEKLNKLGGAGSKPKLKGNRNAAKKVES